MNDVEAPLAPHPLRQTEFVVQGGGVLKQVDPDSTRLDGHVVAVDMNAVEFLIAFVVLFSLRANHGHDVSGPGERGRFLPDAAVERNREIFDNDQNAANVSVTS